jgi:photosystem II stability/assembly factor-like uncharacterized protein
MSILFVATTQGLIVLERENGVWHEAGGAQHGRNLTCIARAGDNLLAGSTEGVLRSRDLGQTWWQSDAGLSERHLRSLVYVRGDGSRACAGTEPAAIFASEDGGRTWQECPEIAALRDENEWYLPYSPRAGAIRGLAFQGERGYAAAEQGGMLRSDDGGRTWSLVEGSSGRVRGLLPAGHIHPDVHSVVVHPSSVDQVFAPTGGGLYHSANGGRIWERLHEAYCRAVWVDPLRPAHLLLGIADGPDRNGRIVESWNGGTSWRPLGEGVPVPMRNHMVERLTPLGEEILALLSNGELLVAALDGLSWRTLLASSFEARDVVAVLED